MQWIGPCSADSVPPQCMINVRADRVAIWDQLFPGVGTGATTAVFEPIPAGTMQYSYDDIGRLTGVVFADGSALTYSYDNNGNMLSREVTQP